MLQKVHFTMNGKPIAVQDWQFNDTEGGHDQCSGVMEKSRWDALGRPTQGALVAAYQDDGSNLWGGRLAAPPQIIDGRAHFNAVGHKEEAAKKVDRLFIQSADMSQWVDAESEPHLSGGAPVYPNIQRFDPSVRGSLVWRLNGGQALSTSHAHAFVFYAEGVNLQVVRYTSSFTAGDAFAKLSMRAQRANGPTGAEASFGSHTLAIGNQNVAQEFIHANTGNDLILLQIECTDGTFAPSASKMKWTANNVRVNSDVSNSTSMHAWEVIEYIGTQLVWDTSGLTSSSYNVLPFDWEDGNWLDAMLYLAELEDNFVRVGGRSSTGPRVEYDAWGTEDWTVYTTHGAIPDLKPLEFFNVAWVWFETGAGVRRRSTRDTTDAGVTDPLEAAGITNIVEFELEDRQTSSQTLANNVGDKLVTRYAAPRYAGTIDVGDAVSTRGRGSNPRLIRYGDTINIADWDDNESQRLRVMEVSQTADGITVGAEQPVNLVDIMENTRGGGRRRKRKRRKKK